MLPVPRVSYRVLAFELLQARRTRDFVVCVASPSRQAKSSLGRSTVVKFSGDSTRRRLFFFVLDTVMRVTSFAISHLLLVVEYSISSMSWQLGVGWRRCSEVKGRSLVGSSVLVLLRFAPILIERVAWRSRCRVFALDVLWVRHGRVDENAKLVKEILRVCVGVRVICVCNSCCEKCNVRPAWRKESLHGGWKKDTYPFCSSRYSSLRDM